MTPTEQQEQEQPSPTSTTIMPASPSRTGTLLANLSSVTSRISTAALNANRPATKPIRLIAVSKLKPAADILALHNPPTNHLHFGENYLQELLEKSKLLPPSIRWHFIGGLQSNKCVTLARDVRGLWAVESVDNEKKASLLDRGWGERSEEVRSVAHEDRLRVFVQVNTSGEENKAGVDPVAGAVPLARFIREKCPRLKLQGVMTIGAIARSKATTPETENEDFVCLRETRDRIVRELGLQGDDTELELSMGMSEDFEGAIKLGSDEVRVGTTIFGVRPPKSEAKVV
ncbi:hypothetical protein KXV92_007742 [Aspergillus fumigatus]|nr:hypothetical protein KXX42_001851 [Aspergillus fumigatus]KAH2302409.1 hypothetical protein KXV47_001213 [Aspergillus fumigatus]KAH2659745.1 hypothetical protein KXV32_001336 [Aspergillus fumigatus]KAH3207550.1 hypothetical protein KXV92_007742 [Aspergillus fumigatus]KAH3526361.1 hypothetical protein KXV64_004270 [Aspergillus fumigatus]